MLLKSAAKGAINKVKAKSGMSAFDVGVAGYFGMSTFNDARAQGNSIVSSAVTGGTEMVLPYLMGGWAYAGLTVASILPSAAVSVAESYGQYDRNLARQKLAKPFMNSSFADSREAFTMRQAGMALAQRSKYNLQQAMLGNEATYLHKS